ncbi:cytochrome c-type biogenesis protein [Photobacterium aquae]|uniref:cytochrome c-type biogenesis protein n=1 Tax=Photobacterium aquae TaxID=1195763 RepID=UPI000A053471|nr:cytochrome c-type biogenesis protein [Photobacterium aquae]
MKSVNLFKGACSAFFAAALTVTAYTSVAALTAVATAPAAVAAIDVYEFKDVEQEKEFHELTQTLRCPKCQNNSIADSNAPLAQDMRQKAFEMLNEGKSKTDVVDYMIARYGNFVTYNPPVMMSTIILWAGPVVFILVGFTVLVLRSRKRGEPVTDSKFDAEEQARLKALMTELDASENDGNNADNQNGKVSK